MLQILIYMAGYYYHFFNTEFTAATKLKVATTSFNYYSNIIRHVLIPLLQMRNRMRRVVGELVRVSTMGRST